MPANAGVYEFINQCNWLVKQEYVYKHPIVTDIPLERNPGLTI